jgi:CRP-like cAMP-binding protein
MLTTAKEINALVNLFHQGTKLTFKKGNFLIPPGESPGGVYYVASGLVKIYDVTKFEEQNLLVIRQTGDILGISATIRDIQSNVKYVALGPTTVFYVTREQFTTFLQKNPRAALPLVEMLVDMYNASSKRIMNLGYRTVKERLAFFLISNAERFGEETPEGMLIKAPLRRKDLADAISATRETVSREICLLETGGIISRGKPRSIITILDMDQLRSILA